ncbi:MAG: RluA family pseudouridine synthase [Alphaproteobacteria bacterium]|nr:RluA family pseudouridine synthase [Alphaproteobacteria bacterium]
MRLDKFLSEVLCNLSRNQYIRLIEQGNVQENASHLIITKPDYKVQEGQSFLIQFPEAVPAEPEPENIPLDIVYEDADLLVINKPAGMVVHPGAGNWNNTLVNALLAHCPESLSGIGGVKRPGIVHRIDKDTSGLLVVAKNDFAHQELSKQFSIHSIERTYDAFVWGRVEQADGKIEGNIGRSNTNRQKMALVSQGGKTAVTHYTRLAVYGGGTASHIQCVLETGRTHQIRVHMASLHHALIGDYTYGKAPKTAPDFLRNFPRQALHAGLLGFNHPRTQKHMVFQTPMPTDMQELKNFLEAL